MVISSSFRSRKAKGFGDGQEAIVDCAAFFYEEGIGWGESLYMDEVHNRGQNCRREKPKTISCTKIQKTANIFAEDRSQLIIKAKTGNRKRYQNQKNTDCLCAKTENPNTSLL